MERSADGDLVTGGIMTTKGGRAKLLFILVIVLLSLGFVSTLVWTIVTQDKTISTQQARIAEQNKTIEHVTDELIDAQNNSQTLYDQIVAMGETPQGENPQTTTGTPGRNGTNGRDGRDGLPGKDGTNGIDGVNGQDGTNGLDGEPGKDGKDGAPGATGPQGPAGPTCAEGTAPTQVWIQTRSNPDEPPTQDWQLATICMAPAPATTP